jgi:hypothetical protein
MIAESMVATGFRAGVRETKVRSVGLGLEKHFRRAYDLDGIGVCLGIA